MYENNFDGIILPFFGGVGIGRVLGTSVRELRFGGEDIKLNIAIPNREEVRKFGLFWLENFPETPEYSKKASYYWLLREFSKLNDFGEYAIRVRPGEKGFGRPVDHEFIFWEKGKPLSVGEQYSAGINMIRPDQKITLFDVILSWQQKEYELRYCDRVGKLDEVTEQTFNLSKIPHLQIEKVKERLTIEARNVGWKTQYALVDSYV